VRAYASAERLLSAQLQAEHGLTLNAYEALLVISREEEQRMKRVDLARSLLLTPSGVTRLLDGMEREGFVERASCATDRRIAYAQLTDAGRDKLKQAAESHVASVHELFEGHYSEQELNHLSEMLEKLPEVAGDDAATCGN
jgi:DNA-binding MarR family transcriptional regulator